MKKINWARVLGDIDPTPEYKDVVVPKTFSGVWCQNVKKHPIVRHPITGEPKRMRPVECEKLEDGTYFCPTCNEEVNVDPPRMTSWGEVDTRAAWPKSITRIL